MKIHPSELFSTTQVIIYFLQTASNPLLCFYTLYWGKNSPVIHRLSQRYVKGIMCKRWKVWENTFWRFCTKASKILKMKNLAAFISHTGKITFYLCMWRETTTVFQHGTNAILQYWAPASNWPVMNVQCKCSSWRCSNLSDWLSEGKHFGELVRQHAEPGSFYSWQS